MDWIKFKNSEPVKISDIPVHGVEQLRALIIKECSFGHEAPKRPVLFFSYKDQSVKLLCVLADDESNELLAARADFSGRHLYVSITPEIPSFHMFEREIYEEFGIHPVEHPWLKPVRYSHDRFDNRHSMKNYPFFNFDGEEVHEVGVGPVHAGIIEPGHFRFMCTGEKVNNLEIQLGYQHRGVEKLFLEGDLLRKVCLAESIVGDTVVGHTWAYVRGVEALRNIDVNRHVEILRAVFLEMERIAMHLADLSALSNDVAYLMGSSVYGAIRTLVINSLLSICGNRFGRGFFSVGGVRFSVSKKQKKELSKTLLKVLRDTERMSETMFSTPTVLSRFEQTGIITEDIAASLGLLGLSARASGLAVDVRVDQPFGIYNDKPATKHFLETGDVYARAYMRYLEIKDSIYYVLDLLENIEDGDYDNTVRQTESINLKDSLVVSMIEGWRGELAHAVVTGANGEILKYKIKDPSLVNWYGLSLAVKHNGVSDFPLCNKSFNLSYCGSDL